MSPQKPRFRTTMVTNTLAYLYINHTAFYYINIYYYVITIGLRATIGLHRFACTLSSRLPWSWSLITNANDVEYT